MLDAQGRTEKLFKIQVHDGLVLATINAGADKVKYFLDNEKSYKKCSVMEFFFFMQAEEIEKDQRDEG